MKITIEVEVEVPDWFDTQEQIWEVEKAAQEWVDANCYDIQDSMDYDDWKGPSYEDVIDSKGRL